MGAPAVRRTKTYSAASGYVYQYVYEGLRRLKKPKCEEYVFSASAGRAPWMQVSVTLPDDTLARWQAARSRELSSTERYAIAKLALLRSFDDAAVPEALASRTSVTAAALDAIAETLGWD